MFGKVLAVAAVVVGVFVYKLSGNNLLKDFSEDMEVGHWGLQAVGAGFCLNPGLVEELNSKSDTTNFDSHQQDMATTDFESDGNINEDDYTKQSIYSLLYALYKDMGNVVFHGEAYQFRFNTWGVGGVYDENGNKNGRADMSVCKDDICNGVNNLAGYPATQPQRHGKTAYAGLLNFNTIKAYMKKIAATENNRPIKVVEIGCGTGAGANELSWLHPNLEYYAVDMQAQAIKSCKSMHASQHARFTADFGSVRDGVTVYPDMGADSRLTCIHANGQELDKYFEDGFADIVLISETHIADVVPLDTETKNVLNQMHRILRPGGHFVWGNAIPTSIWGNAIHYLHTDLGMERQEIHDVTDNAVIARDEDFDRVEHFLETLKNRYWALGQSERCYKALNRLISNFYRHPGTALYKRMLVNSNITATEEENRKDWTWCEEYGAPTSICTDNRIDTYAHMCYKKI